MKVKAKCARALIRYLKAKESERENSNELCTTKLYYATCRQRVCGQNKDNLCLHAIWRSCAFNRGPMTMPVLDGPMTMPVLDGVKQWQLHYPFAEQAPLRKDTSKRRLLYVVFERPILVDWRCRLWRQMTSFFQRLSNVQYWRPQDLCIRANCRPNVVVVDVFFYIKQTYFRHNFILLIGSVHNCSPISQGGILFKLISL